MFGRHVNRAARVESLTPPGHSLITRPVYDSAKGWTDNKRYAFVEHGEYRLKGIADPTDIIEPYEKGRIRPGSPRIASFKQRLKRWPLVPLLVIAIAFAFLAILNLYITPLIYYRIAKAGADLDTVNLWGPGWGWISRVLKLAYWFGDDWGFVLIGLSAVLLADRLRHHGIGVARRRYRLLMSFGLVLAVLTGVIYLAETCAMALMLTD